MNSNKHCEIGDKTVVIPIASELDSIDMMLSRYYKQDTSKIYRKGFTKPLVIEGNILSIQSGSNALTFYYKSIGKNKSIHTLSVFNLEQIKDLFKQISKTVKNPDSIKMVSHESCNIVATGKTFDLLTNSPKVSENTTEIVKSYIGEILCRNLLWTHARGEFIPKLLNNIDVSLFNIDNGELISDRSIASHTDFITIEEYIHEQMRTAKECISTIFGDDPWGIYTVEISDVFVKITRRDFRISNWMTLHASQYTSKRR